MFHTVCCDQFLILELRLYRITLSKTSLVLDGLSLQILSGVFYHTWQ